MKKNILLYLLFLVSIAPPCSAQEEKFNFTWTFHFEIASYSQDCNSGFGLCFIAPKFIFRTVESGITLEEQGIRFHMKRSSLSESLESELIRLSLFPIEEGTVLPLEISRKLGINHEVGLKAGRYPLKITDDYITLFCLTD